MNAQGQLLRVAVTGGAPVVVCQLATDLFGASWGADDTIVYGQSDGIWRVPAAASGTANYAVSGNGSLVYVPQAVAGGNRTLALVDRNSVVDTIDAPPALYQRARVSPDGTRLVVQLTGGAGSDIWVYDLSGQTPIRRLTLEGNNVAPIWTPDGERVTFASDRDGTQSLYWQPVDGSGVAERLATADADGPQTPDSWSPDGRVLAFEVGTAQDLSLWTLTIGDGKEGEGNEPQLFYDIPGLNQLGAEFSPGGRWIAYASGVIRAGQIYVQPFPATGAIHQVTQQEGADLPLWSRDGKELFYRHVTDGQDRLVRVDVNLDGTLTWGAQQTLPVEGYWITPGTRNYDIMPDGQHLLMVFPERAASGDATRPRIDIVLNWFEELEARAPVP